MERPAKIKATKEERSRALARVLEVTGAATGHTVSHLSILVLPSISSGRQDWWLLGLEGDRKIANVSREVAILLDRPYSGKTRALVPYAFDTQSGIKDGLSTVLGVRVFMNEV